VGASLDETEENTTTSSKRPKVERPPEEDIAELWNITIISYAKVRVAVGKFKEG
jgi:hypothetical protein